MINPFFNHYKGPPEQRLIDDLINEVVNMMGFSAHYIPIENPEDRDLLYGEDPLKKFETVYEIELYLTNAVDPGLNQDFFSKFGLEIKNNIRVLFTRRSFETNIGIEYNRPKEGDLIYIPWASGTGELYEIKYVNDSKDGFMLGRSVPYMYELELETFKYSHERINTLVDEIDGINLNDSYIIEFDLGTGTGNYIQNENVYQGNNIIDSTATGVVEIWDASTKKLTLCHMTGTFANTITIIGESSNAQYVLSSYDDIDIPIMENAWDNQVVKEESSLVINTEETNPLGHLGHF